jgi:hypothetical protein
VKFVSSKQLGYGERIATIAMEWIDFNSEAEKRKFWSTHRALVNPSLTQKRTSLNKTIQTRFFGECAMLRCRRDSVVTLRANTPFLPFSIGAALHQSNELPTKKDLLSPRAYIEIFTLFCDHFLSCTFPGKVAYRESSLSCPISEFVEISDEAYTLAYLESSYDQWLAQAEDFKKENVTYPLTKRALDPRATTVYKRGWTNKGMIERYNALQKATEMKRSMTETKQLEQEYLEHVRGRSGNAWAILKRRNEPVVCAIIDAFSLSE